MWKTRRVTGVSANLAELLAEAAVAVPDQVAVVEAESGRSLTWAALDDSVSRLAHGLQQRGLVAGNRVVIDTANRLELVQAYFAVLRARLVAVPVNPRSATGELVRMVADCGARLIVADASTVTPARSVVAGIQDALVGADEDLVARTPVPAVVTVGVPALPGEVRWDDLLTSDPIDLPPARDPEALAVLLYTSGASGRPRAAMLSHRALVANLEQAAAVDPPMVGGGDVVYGVLPLFHVYGLNAVLGSVVRQRARLVLAESFDPEQALVHIADHGVTVLPVAPAVFGHWRRVPDLADRLASVRLVVSGSAPLAPEVAAEFTSRTGLSVHQGYGLTEAAPVVTSTLCSAGGGPAKPGSVGRALPGVRVRLVDDSGAAPEGEDPGQILVAGDNLFDGYWPDRADGPVDGWLATGDVGFLDEDGDLFLVDRLKELILVSGFNVYPSEIEDVLREVEGVAEAAVVGMPDEATGEAVHAYLRARPGVDAADLRERALAACARRLARFKQPRVLEVVSELPHTVTGKIAKGKLRATIRRQHLGLLE